MTLPSPVRNEHCYVFVSSLSKPIHSELDAAARKRRSVPMAATINNSARKNSNRLLHLRMRRGNACGRVCVCVCVCQSVCMSCSGFNLDLETSFLVCIRIHPGQFRISRSGQSNSSKKLVCVSRSGSNF